MSRPAPRRLAAPPRAAHRPRRTSHSSFETLEPRRLLAPVISELFIDGPASAGDLLYEYIELRGEAGASLDNLYLIILENEGLPDANPGDIDMIFDLNGLTFGDNGFLSMRQKNTSPNQYTPVAGGNNLRNESASSASRGWGSAGPGSSNPTTLPVMDDGNDGEMENSGGTYMLIDRGAGPAPTLLDDLDADNDGLLDHPSGKEGWTILDSIGVYVEEGEAATGRLYGMVNFGPEASTTSLVGPYYGVGYEIELVARWGNSTGHAESDWHVTNVTDNGGSGHTGHGDFRQSGQPEHGFGNQTLIESNRGVPYGANLTATLGGPNFINASVAGRHVFYNQSAFDGNSPLIDANDNNAVATDKSAYLAGDGTFPISAMTNYSRGINGVMIDVKHLLTPPTLDDFKFRASNQGTGAAGPNNAPDSWLPAPSGLSVFSDTPELGTDRIVITWANDAIKNRYLQVTLKGADTVGGYDFNTGLPATDVFYFGNKAGDTFTGTGTNWNTGAADESEIRGNASPNVPITNIWDIDKNKFAGAAVDQQAARAANFGLMTRIDIAPAAAPRAAAAGNSAGGAVEGAHAAVVAALAEPWQPATPGEPAQTLWRPEDRAASAAGGISPLKDTPELCVYAKPSPVARAAADALDDEFLAALLDLMSRFD